MSRRYPLEALLRPPVELTSALAAGSLAALTVVAPQSLLLAPAVADGCALGLGLFAFWRLRQGWRIVRYRRGLRRLPHYALSSRRIPCSPDGLFLGRGFLWTPVHTQRLWEATRPDSRRFLEPGLGYRLARGLEAQWPGLRSVLGVESAWNPVRPLPPVGGLPALHGVGLPEGERAVRLPASERQGHLFYVGTTGVGKTRAAELALIQDIRNGHPVICLDPKGDPDLFRRLYSESKRAGRTFFFFHLGYPDHSARYNPIGRFARITEVATRIANQLPSEGNAAAFRQFAWLFTHVIARALTALGQRPDYRQILRYMNHIEPLLVRYFTHWLEREGPPGWREAVTAMQSGKDRRLPSHLAGRDPQAIALVGFYKEQGLYDPVAEGLKRAWEYEKTFFDKISVAVQPLLEKLLAGPLAGLLNPDYTVLDDPRPLLDWPTVFRRRAVVYCGFDALTDPDVASVVAQSLIADLVAYAGEIYKHGIGQGLPEPEPTPETCLHLDEFAELVRGPEIIQALNKGRGAGLRFSIYTQTLADLEAGLGSRARAEQVLGNATNTLIMLRVADIATARLFTDRLGQVEVNALMQVSGATDSATPDSSVDFTSATQERISSQTVPLLEPGHLLQLPRGQAFVLMEGGRVYKVRLPLPSTQDADLPPAFADIAREMARRYRRGPLGWADEQEMPLRNNGTGAGER